jgi:hypothetical protein
MKPHTMRPSHIQKAIRATTPQTVSAAMEAGRISGAADFVRMKLPAERRIIARK